MKSPDGSAWEILTRLRTTATAPTNPTVESGVDDDPNWSVLNVEEPLDSPMEGVAVVESGPELQVSVVDEESNPYSKDAEVEEDAKDGQSIVAGLESLVLGREEEVMEPILKSYSW